MSTRIRTNAHPVILTSSPKRGIRSDDPSGEYAATQRARKADTENVILDAARDLAEGGDLHLWACDLYEACQWLRMDYDSPRIGGGIAPDVRLVGTLDAAREENPILGYLIGNAESIEVAYRDHYHNAARSGASGTDLDKLTESYRPENYRDLLDGYPPERVQDCIVHAEAVAALIISLAESEAR